MDAALRLVLTKEVRLQRDVLAARTLDLLGFGRAGKRLLKAGEEALGRLLAAGAAEVDDEGWVTLAG